MDSYGSLCPACGSLKVKEDTCPECSFSFSSVLRCPFINKDDVCTKNDSNCNVKGIDFEICETMRESK